jgi:hypothetical protein
MASSTWASAIAIQRRHQAHQWPSLILTPHLRAEMGKRPSPSQRLSTMTMPAPSNSSSIRTAVITSSR